MGTIKKHLLICSTAILFVSVISVQAADPATHKPVVFTAMGCGPYTQEAETALTKFIRLENKTPSSAFIIHCGDIVTGKVKDWPESQYAKVANILKESNQIPTFIVPGDNEWNDQIDPDRHWGYWEKHFMKFDDAWELPKPASVARQETRPENFSFVLDGVLFIGINKVGGLVHDESEWAARHKENATWISEQFKKHRDDTHAAAIFAQASAVGNTTAFVSDLRTSAAKYAHPILYLHANGHKWFVLENEWADNITHVQLDVVNAIFPPVQITVSGDPTEPFTFDRRLKDPAWRPQP
tara:strand:+ start:403 stop:1293 length:891 start_codon:yes stop_codon:yes gene_type:complete